MEVLCEESHSEQINIYVTSVRFSHGADAMIFNYKTLIWSFTYISDPQPRVLKAALIYSCLPCFNTLFFVKVCDFSTCYLRHINRGEN